jgi:hypothetical protein
MANSDLLHSLLDYERLLFHYDEWRTKNRCSLSRMNWMNSFVISRRTEYFTMTYIIHCHGNVLTEPLPNSGWFLDYSLQREHVLGERLANIGLPLWLHYSRNSGVVSQYIKFTIDVDNLISFGDKYLQLIDCL